MPAGGTQLASFRKVFDQPRTADGKPLTFFLGGQFCPFGASMRWPLVRALERFGTFSGLGEMHSKGGTDGFGSITTYDFAHATYKSDFVALQTVEAADASGNPLQQPNGEQSALINRFDPNGSIPFVFIAGQDVAQVPYSPDILVGKSFSEIKADIESATPGEIGRAINAEADAMTAVLCKTTAGKPAEVCGTPGIQALIQQAPQTALVAALRLVYGDRRYLAAAFRVAVASIAVLAWSSQVITYFPQGGFFVDVDAITGAGLLLTSLLIGITYPLHWFAWRRAQRSAASQGIGFVGALIGVGSMSCCAPLLLPGVLGVAGFSGASLLSLNMRLHQLRLPLVALAVFFLAVTLWAGTRNVNRACRLSPPPPAHA